MSTFTHQSQNSAIFTHLGQSLVNSFLQLENGGYLLQEDGTSKLILEGVADRLPSYTHVAQEVG